MHFRPHVRNKHHRALSCHCFVAIGNQEKKLMVKHHQSGNLCSAVMLQVVMFYSYGVNCVVKVR